MDDVLIFVICLVLLVFLITWKLIPYVKELRNVRNNEIGLNYIILMLPKFLFESFILNRKL